MRVERKVKEGDKERIQVIEGRVIARKHGNQAGATITVRKIASGVGVEFIFPLHSPRIKSIKVVKRSKTKRSKLYYLRGRSGKSARMKNDREVVVKEEGKAGKAEEVKEKKEKEVKGSKKRGEGKKKKEKSEKQEKKDKNK